MQGCGLTDELRWIAGGGFGCWQHLWRGVASKPRVAMHSASKGARRACSGCAEDGRDGRQSGQLPACCGATTLEGEVRTHARASERVSRRKQCGRWSRLSRTSTSLSMNC
eukprot:2419223-Rhodomonas_salina.2